MRRSGTFLKFLLRRLALSLVTLWLLSVIIFAAGQLLPGDVGRAMLGPLAAARAARVDKPSAPIRGAAIPIMPAWRRRSRRASRPAINSSITAFSSGVVCLRSLSKSLFIVRS